ncbi:TPA: hypothetical protein SCS57_002043 [Enterobacter cloacae]|nr:hypothetical protein [Enterobacter cloacae]
MGLFGSAQRTKTTVKPSPQVEKLLKDIVSRTEGMEDQDFVEHPFANFSDAEIKKLNEVAESGNTRQAAALLTNRLSQGNEQMNQSNTQLQNAINSPITAQSVLDESKAMRDSGTFKTSQAQAASAGGVANKFGAVGRSVARRGASQQAARSALNPTFNNLAISNQAKNTAGNIDTANAMGRIGGANQGLGLQGVQLNDQATQNQLMVGNIQQAYQNAMNTNNWQNANGRQLNQWNNLNNKLNILNEVSPMAGYTTYGSGSAPSKAQQLGGAAITGLGIYGKLGGFNPTDAKQQVDQVGTGANAIPVYQYNNQLYNQGGTGIFNGVGSWFGGYK